MTTSKSMHFLLIRLLMDELQYCLICSCGLSTIYFSWLSRTPWKPQEFGLGSLGLRKALHIERYNFNYFYILMVLKT